MKNKIDLVNDAFSMLLRTGVTVQATNADIELALGRLEDVMSELESRNLATGYNFESPPQPDSPSGLEDYMNLAVSRLLAVNVWPDFSPEAVNQMLLMQSAQSQSNLSARLAQQSMLKYAKRMPLGSGNQPYQQYQKFYGDYSADCGTGCAIPAASPVPPPFDSDAIVVDNLKLLASESTSEATGKAFFVNSFYAGWSTPSGGGWFVWSASESKANHNGVTVYAPEALVAWNGTQADIATLLNWTGSGSGCWVRNDLQGFVTPEMAGAVGDGVADDKSALQAAIYFQAANGAHAVLFSGKTYISSGLLWFPSKMNLVGQKGVTKIQLPPNTSSQIAASVGQNIGVYVNDIEISGIIFDSNSVPTATYTQSAVTINFARRIKIEDCIFENATGYGLGMQANPGSSLNGVQEDLILRNLIFRNNGFHQNPAVSDTFDGMDIKYAGRIRAENLESYNNSDKGLDIRCESGFISNLRTEGNGSIGVEVVCKEAWRTFVDGIQSRNNTTNGFVLVYTGTTVGDTAVLNFSNIICEDNGSHNVRIYANSGAATTNVVINGTNITSVRSGGHGFIAGFPNNCKGFNIANLVTIDNALSGISNLTDNAKYIGGYVSGNAIGVETSAGKKCNLVGLGIEGNTANIGGSSADINFTACDGATLPVRFTYSQNAINRLRIESRTAGGGPRIASEGVDTNIELALSTKGSGLVRFFRDDFGSETLRLSGAVGSTSFFQLTSSTANRPQIQAAGTPADIDIEVVPKGAGRVRFGTITATADAPITGYIEIKDASGTIRKLAVIS